MAQRHVLRTFLDTVSGIQTVCVQAVLCYTVLGMDHEVLLFQVLPSRTLCHLVPCTGRTTQRPGPYNQQKQMGRAGPITLRAEPGRARKLRPVEARQHNLHLTILQLVN